MGDATSNVVAQITTAMGTIQADGLAVVGAVFPVIVTITGAIVVWRLAIGIFRRAAS